MVKLKKRFVHHVNQTLHNNCNKDSQMKEQRMDGEWWMVKTLTMHGNVRCYESKTREICLCNVHISNLMRIGGHTLCSIIWALSFVEDRGYHKRLVIHKEHDSQDFVFGGGEIIKFYFQLRRKYEQDRFKFRLQ